MKRLFPSLTDDPKLGDVFRRFPEGLAPLMEYHDRVLRDEGPLTVGERELIAAYVSSLNACSFCLDGHVTFARAHGIDAEVIAALLEDVESEVVDPKLRPILKYVAKLTLTPSRILKVQTLPPSVASQEVARTGTNESVRSRSNQTRPSYTLF